MPTHLAEPIQDEAESNRVAADAPSPAGTPKTVEPPTQTERLAYSIQEAARLLGVNYFSVYRLVQRGKLKVCRALRGKLLVPRSELLKLLKTE
jgi:excisionase family DNA binding protein